jgi:quercetin dioxygenase-like cupin family protein
MSCVANLFSRMMHFQKKGDRDGGHSHVFNHLTLLAKGSLEVTVDGQTTVFNAPHMIYIRKDKLHELVALEDDTLAFCIHALRDGEGVDDILDPDSIPQGADMGQILRKITNN